MRGVLVAVGVVLVLALGGWMVQKPAPLPDMPLAPLVTPGESKPMQTRRLEIIGEDGEVGMVFVVEKGISYVIVNDAGKQRKVNLTSASRRL